MSTDSDQSDALASAITHALLGLYTLASGGVIALVLTLILGATPATGGAIWLVLELNVLAIPLVLLTDVASVPPWVWYVIVIHWIGALVVRSRVTSASRSDEAGIEDEIEADLE